MSREHDQISKALRQATAFEESHSPAFEANPSVVPLEVFLSTVRPAIVRKAANLRQQRKERNEKRILWAGYLLFLILVPLYLLEYAVHGFSHSISALLLVVGGFIVISFFCLPLVYIVKGRPKMNREE